MTGERDAHVSESEVEIPADPAEVWTAITTASGTAAWFFPAEVEPREGGAIRLHRAPFAPDAVGTVTAWEPPRRFAYAEQGEPTIATEMMVEAREQGSCVVRVVSTLYADGAGWDDIAEQVGAGWQMALQLLRSYVTHFAGLPAARIDLSMPVGAPPEARAEVGARLAASLGARGAPLAGGTVEHLEPHFVLVRTEEPTPALFAVSAFSMDAVTLSVNVAGRRYGPGAEAAAERDRPRWREWLAEFVDNVETRST
jgi:uncharacterized protein YndB with AHSA1/START domain